VFETVFASPLGLEGLTTDGRGYLYSPARGADPCPVYRVAATGGPAAVVGTIPAPCSPAGLTFDRRGRLYVANADTVVSFVPDAANPPAATVFTRGVPGANGLAFDRAGALWISDGGTGQGRVWRAGTDGVAAEMLRVQPLVSDVNVVNGVGGVGRDVRGLPPGSVTITPNGRTAADTAGSQHIVANGLAFTADGTLLVADTARGALWRVPMGRDGRPRASTGCDAAFPANTLAWTTSRSSTRISKAPTGSSSTARATSGRPRTSATRSCWPGATAASSSTSATPPTRRRNCATAGRSNSRPAFPNTAGESGPGKPALAKISCVKR
jgi:hypothetical protein